METNTSLTFLKYSKTEDGDYKKVCDIKDYPDEELPDELDVTTLSDTSERSIPGIGKGSIKKYTANYSKEDYEAIKAMDGETLYFKEEFGEDGVEGVSSFKGRIKVTIVGKGVNEVREMTVQIYKS